MRVTHISAADNRGGGARSAYRLHHALLAQGVESCMYVKRKYTDDESVVSYTHGAQGLLGRLRFALRRRWETGKIGYLKNVDTRHIGFAPPTSPFGPAPLAQLPQADIVNLHWVAGFWDFRCLPRLTATCRAVVWRLSDMNPFTGGCFYDDHCGKFQENCGRCPCLNSLKDNDLSRRSLQLKKRISASLPAGFLHIVAQSRWQEKLIKKSSVFRDLNVSRIPNGIDISEFRPGDQVAARAFFGLPPDRLVILFVAQSLANPLKGGVFFAEAIKNLARETGAALTVLAVGKNNLPAIDNVQTLQMNIDDNEKLALAYRAADVFVITSLQDNLPNTVLESMACATPVVGFDVGGIPDMVVDGETGFLGPARDIDSLARNINLLITNKELANRLGKNCREHVSKQFSLEKQAQSYIELYEQLSNISHAGHQQ